MIVDFDNATVIDLHLFFSNNFNTNVLPLLKISDVVSQPVIACKNKIGFGILNKQINFLKNTFLFAVESFQVLISK